ncbi:MAG: type II toxin-antitoxin system VapC family toxin [Candidatus Jordarchaeales archaeon]|nr:type II toxin-antitoxin system VapC family toxin [Candidatus Jordarchaeia archaeon]
MKERSVYLDTSAIVKRYVVEEGSSRVDEFYDEAHAGRATLGFSIWNIGEVAVVLDKYERRDVLSDAKQVFARFVGETRLLAKLNQLKLVPLNSAVIFAATKYVFKHGIYVADAIQLASAREFNLFLTYDKKLSRIAKDEKLKLAINEEAS